MARKKIFIEGLGLVEGHFSGVGQYILGILQGMDQIIDDQKNRGEPHYEVCVLVPFNKVQKFKSYGLRHIRYKRFPLTFKYVAALWHRGWMPPIDLFFGKGAYIFPRFVSMPLLFSKNAGLVIYDLSYETHREFADTKNAIFLSNMVKKSLLLKPPVITISQSAKQELVEFYKLPNSAVKVATPAVDQRYFFKRPKEQIRDIKRKYSITSKNYVLALSNLEPRKNLEALVDAYCSLSPAVRKDTSLVLVGVTGWKSEELFQKIVSKVKEGYDIVRPSKYVTDTDKPAFISGASVLVFPSHYEGFGMPPLEALACGVPVITANNSSLPEVVGDVGEMVSSKDQTALNQALADVLSNIEYHRKKTMVAGPQKASEFSWKKSAQVFLDNADEVLK